MYPVCYSCHAASAVTVGSIPSSAWLHWRCWGIPGGSSMRCQQLCPAPIAQCLVQLQHMLGVSNCKVEFIRLAGTLRKKLKEEFQCEVLVKETADPALSYLSLLQTPHFTLTLLHCPSMVPLWKAYLILKYILDSSVLPQQHTALKYS